MGTRFVRVSERIFLCMLAARMTTRMHKTADGQMGWSEYEIAGMGTRRDGGEHAAICFAHLALRQWGSQAHVFDYHFLPEPTDRTTEACGRGQNSPRVNLN